MSDKTAIVTIQPMYLAKADRVALMCNEPTASAIRAARPLPKGGA